MSFILDALKKSENDRQRNTGPALFEVKVAAPRNRVPVWMIVIAALLIVNLGVVAWLLMREPSTQVARATAPAAQSAPAAPSAMTAPNAAAPAPQTTAPAQASAQPQVIEAPATDSEPIAQTAPEEGNPDDYAPAVEPGNAAPAREPFVRRGTESGLPTYEEVSTNGKAPQLRMDLHVFAPRPQDRFVLINMQRLREGDTMPDGVRVDSITSDGAILSYRGERFVLHQ